MREDVILYHGSRGGIEGAIQPSSRARCDFGTGFYMGTDFMQAKSLVANDDVPFVYKVRFRLSEIPDDKIKVLKDEQWIHAVLSFRRSIREYASLAVAEQTRKELSRYDVLIGVIADDKMREAMNAFTENALTDAGLMYCLQSVDYGLQYVAKTAFACSKIDILEEKRLSGVELQQTYDYSDKKVMACRSVVKEAKMQYDNTGLRLSEILRREQEKEQNAK